MNKSSFFIAGQHAVIEALRNPDRKVLRVFLTEDAKKNIHRKNPRKNVLEDVKVYFKSKKELDKYTSKEQLMHNGYVAEVEHLDQPDLKEYIREKKNCTFVCLDEVTDPRNIGSLIRSAASFKIDGLIIKERHFPKDSKLMYKSADLYMSLLSLGKCLSFIIKPSILNDAALLINEPIFLGSVTSSKHTKVQFFFSLMYSFKSGWSKCSTSAT